MKKGFSTAALDNWITGNFGENHPDNVEPQERCKECNSEYSAENMSADYPESICKTCYSDGARICSACGDSDHIDSLLSENPDSIPRLAFLLQRGRFPNRETFCESCMEENCYNCKGHPDYCRSELCMIPLREADKIESQRLTVARRILAERAEKGES